MARTGLTFGALALAGALTLAACGDDSTTSTSASGNAAATSAAVVNVPSSATATTAATPVTTTAAAGATTAKPSTGTKVNANTASVAELTTALTNAGVPNADRWAKEVEEYRPYPNDPTWAKLRQNLAKYNPPADVLEKLLAALTV